MNSRLYGFKIHQLAYRSQQDPFTEQPQNREVETPVS